MMDAVIVEVVEAYVHAGLPTDAAAVLLVEVDGLPDGVDEQTRRVRDVLLAHHARTVRVAGDAGRAGPVVEGPQVGLRRRRPDRPQLLPARLRGAPHQAGRGARRGGTHRGRHDLILGNVFHAGDGNLHPLIVFDRRVPGVLERVHAAGQEIVEACVAAGGTLSGEHGIGLEKRDAMPLVFSAADLEAQTLAARRLRPGRAVQPREGPAPGRLSLRGHRHAAAGRVGVTPGPRDTFAAEVGPTGPVRVVGGRTQWDVGGAARGGSGRWPPRPVWSPTNRPR